MQNGAIARLFFILLLGILISGCSKFRKIESNPDWRVKYEAALRYYEDEDFYRAAILFEQIMPIVRGLPEGEKVQYLYANTQFNQGFYLLASHHFKSFYETYGRSSLAEDARYLYAFSLYKDAPAYNLDQTSSKQALFAMQTFLNRYPSSKYREEASTVINDIQQKLEKKAYENARQYYILSRYKSAILAFENFSKEFPDSEYNEEALYLRFVAQYRLARQSISSLQLERYRETAEFYRTFIDKYPNSRYIKEAEKFYSESMDQINELAKK